MHESLTIELWKENYQTSFYATTWDEVLLLVDYGFGVHGDVYDGRVIKCLKERSTETQSEDAMTTGRFLKRVTIE